MALMSLFVTCAGLMMSLTAANLSNFYVNAERNEPTTDEQNNQIAAAQQRLLHQRLIESFLPILQAESAAATSLTNGRSLAKTKKSWQKLQGSWGKRSDMSMFDEVGNDVDSDAGNDEDGAGGGGDERTFDLSNEFSSAYDPARLYLDDADVETQRQSKQRQEPTKRAWNSMSAGWGKRIGNYKYCFLFVPLVTINIHIMKKNFNIITLF